MDGKNRCALNFMEVDMPVQIVKKSDLSDVLNRWVNDLESGDVDTLEITEKRDQLIIKRHQKGRGSSRGAVLETKGTVHLPAETVHEIALSQEILYDG